MEAASLGIEDWEDTEINEPLSRERLKELGEEFVDMTRPGAGIAFVGGIRKKATNDESPGKDEN